MRRLLAARETAAAILLILIFVITGLREPRFLQSQSLESILLFIPILAVIGVGEMTVIVTRGIDISVGSTVGVTAMVVGMLFRAHPTLGLTSGVAAGVGVGLVLGTLNGALVALARVPPIIATLGTFSAFRGLVFIISRSRQVDSNDVPDALTRWSANGPLRIGGLTVSWLLVVALVVCAVAALALAWTRTGRNIFAYGSNPEAARLRGVPVRHVVFLVYALTGACAGLAGVLYLSRYGFVNPASAGAGLELQVIAAVAIGGANIAGGSGSVLGVLLGCLLLGSLNQSLAVLGIDETWQQLSYGAVILVAVLVDGLVRRSGNRRLARA